MNPILEITFEWGITFHPVELAALEPYRTSKEPMQLEKPDTAKGQTENTPRALDWNCRTFWMTAAEAEKFKRKYTVERTLPFSRTPENELAFRHPELPPINTKCNVIVAGNTVMEVKEVVIHIDYCTDRLQEDIVKGWKILAICVQPDQRRPDYILGRI